MSEPHNGNLELIRADIIRARKWMRNRFPTEGSDSILDPPKFILDFEDDCVSVVPKLYGKSLRIHILYKLVWVGKELYWEGRNPASGETIRLKVTE